MTLDDRLQKLALSSYPSYKAKQAILSDLNTIIGEDTGRKHFDTQFEAYAALVQDEQRQRAKGGEIV